MAEWLTRSTRNRLPSGAQVRVLLSSCDWTTVWSIFYIFKGSHTFIHNMKDTIVFGMAVGIAMIPLGITVYNYYVLPASRHTIMMDKLDSFEKRLKKFEEAAATK